jgi:serine/alanine adding enzyme
MNYIAKAEQGWDREFSEKMSVVQHLDPCLWKGFVERHPQGTIFHTPEMFQVFARAKGYRPSLLAVVDSENQPLTLLSVVQVALLNGLFQQFSTRAIAYGSALSAPGREGLEALNLLLRAYNQEIGKGLLFTELRNLTDFSGFQSVLLDNRFTLEGHLNYLIRLDQPEEVLWRGISKSGQQRVRSAYRKEVIVKEINERVELTEAYSLLKAVYSRARVPLADITLFEAAYDLLAPLGMFKIILAKVGEEYIGTRFLLLYKGRIIDWYAGADRNYSTFSPNEILVWHILKWGKENQFQIFDFGGAGRPDEEYGPRQFKSKFGGTLVNYGRFVRVHAPLKLKVSRIGYQLARRFL